MDAFVVGKVTGGDVEKIIGFTCHEVTLPDIRALPDAGFETAERFVREALERDLYDDGGQFLGGAFVNDCAVAADDAAFFQQAHAPQARGWRKSDTLCQVGVAKASIMLKDSQDGFGDAVEDHGGTIGLFSQFRSYIFRLSADYAIIRQDILECMAVVSSFMMNVCSDPLWPSSRAGARLTVDLDAIASNYRYLQTLVAGASCAAVVKADAYGLGIERVAPVLERSGAKEFFVAHVDEGIRLRSGVSEKVRITVLHGPRPDAAAECVQYGLRPVLNSLDQIAVWRSQSVRAGKPLEAVLQVDSGMSRFGLSDGDLDVLHEDEMLMDGLKVSLVMSHLACADAPEHPANGAQRQQMLKMSARLPSAPLSLSASSGIFLGPDYHLDVVRPGAALYGIAPNQTGPNPLSAVVRLQAHVLQIREILPGEGVGYDMTYRPDRPRKIATVAVGYADGFSRHGSGQGCAWFEDICLPILGRVSMDSLIVDISDVPEGRLKADMMVDLIGPRRSVDDVAEAAGTIGYEVLTSLGHRFCREYVGNAETSQKGD